MTAPTTTHRDYVSLPDISEVDRAECARNIGSVRKEKPKAAEKDLSELFKSVTLDPKQSKTTVITISKPAEKGKKA